MMQFCTLLLCITVFLNGFLHAQDNQKAPDIVTLDDAIRIALQNHPSLRAAKAAVRSSEALIAQSQAGYFPAINYTFGGSHIEGAFVFNPSFPARQQLYNSYTTGVQVLQTIYDFGKTGKRVSANKQLAEASEFDAKAVREAVAMNVQTAYFQCLEQQHVVKVGEEAVAQYEKHLTKARALYSVGRRPQFDVTKAQVDLANANVNLIRARNQLRLAKTRLENAMSIHPDNDYSLSDSFSLPTMTMTLDSAQSVALSIRPELQSFRARIEFSKSSVRAEWNQHLPTIAASYNHAWNGFHFPLVSRYTAGLTFSIPIFQGFSISSRVQQAKARVDEAKANTDLLTEQVLMEVEQHYLEMEEAEDRQDAASVLIKHAEENLKIAENRYAAGASSAIEITDAQVMLSNARIIGIQAKYDYCSALVRLYRAMGILKEMPF